MRTAISGARSQAIEVGSLKLGRVVIGWLKRNLFSTWYNSILTVIALWILYKAVSVVLDWGIVNAAFGTTRESCDAVQGACWSFLIKNRALFLVGTYPFDERWRPFTAFLILAGMALASISRDLRAKRWFQGLWFASPVVFMILIRGADFLGLKPVESSLWGGIMLTLILAVGGIGISFPIGLLLALGRRSKMPIIRALSVAYIELIRGVPLITILFMASVLLPLFFPSGFEMDKVLRALIGIILFSAAYVAEVVRGGLQAIPRGQEEAAAAVGLNYWQMMTFIILPQALRIMIPPLVSTFIALFKDTTLVTIIGLIELLGIATLATNNPEWIGKRIEGYVLIAGTFWVFCFGMSRYSVRLEERFKAGHY